MGPNARSELEIIKKKINAMINKKRVGGVVLF